MLLAADSTDAVLDVLSVLATGMVVVAVIHRLLDRAQGAEQAGRSYLTVTMIGSGVAAALWAPASAVALGEVAGSQTLAWHLGNLAQILAASSVVLLEVHIHQPNQLHRCRRIVVTTGVVVTLGMTGLWVLGWALPLRGSAALAASLCYQTHLLLIAGGYIWFVVSTAVYAGRTDRDNATSGKDSGPVIRASIRIAIVAAGCRVAGAVVQLAVALTAAVGTGRPLTSIVPIAIALHLAATTLGCAGTTLAGWTPTLYEWWDRVRVNRAYHRLDELWNVVTAAVPQVVLTGQPGRSTVLDSPDHRLTYRVVDILDASRILRFHSHPDLPLWADELAQRLNLPDPEIQLILAAAVLASGLDGIRAGRPAQDDTWRPPASTELPDVLGEALSLITLGRAMRTNRLVRLLRDRAAAHPT